MNEGGSGAGDARPADGAADLDLPAVLSGLDEVDPAARRRAVETVRRAVEDDPRACVPTVPKLRALLERPSIDVRDRVAYCLAELAAAAPDDVAPSAGTVAEVALETDDGTARTQAYRCLARLAEARPDAVVDRVEPLAADLESAPDPWGISLFAALARERPAAVVPARPALETALETEPGTCGAPATAALGRLVRAEPSVPSSFVDDVVALVDADDPALRANAAGCLADVAGRNPAAVADACPALAGVLDRPDPATRANAAVAIGRVAAATPGVAEDARPHLAALLADDDALVRRNACVLAGHGGVREVRAELERLAADDPDPDVREGADRALDRL